MIEIFKSQPVALCKGQSLKVPIRLEKVSESQLLTKMLNILLRVTVVGSSIQDHPYNKENNHVVKIGCCC